MRWNVIANVRGLLDVEHCADGDASDTPPPSCYVKGMPPRRRRDNGAARARAETPESETSAHEPSTPSHSPPRRPPSRAYRAFHPDWSPRCPSMLVCFDDTLGRRCPGLPRNRVPSASPLSLAVSSRPGGWISSRLGRNLAPSELPLTMNIRHVRGTD
ncbi:hypothetical protein KM043_013629 [Ampulex compressa]|nr:hypothetical protein KM043_013629 [Ampulex compressa]